MRLIHERMSFEDFERLPRRPGWKYEYYGEEAHVTPWGMVRMSLDLEAAGGPPPTGACIRPVDSAADRESLEAAFAAAFEGGAEYPGVFGSALADKAAEYFAGFFGGERGAASKCSRLVTAGGQVVGAALVKELPGQALLDCVFVRPDHARQGLASAAATEAVRGLTSQGERQLVSFVMLANGPSIAWHLRFGFREVPDAWIASHRGRCYAHEAERGRRFGLLEPAEIERFEELAKYWHARARPLGPGSALGPSDVEPNGRAGA